MDNIDWYLKMIQWREKHIGQRQFILVLSVVIGFATSVAANLLKGFIHFIQNFVTESTSRIELYYWYLIFPWGGILLVSLFVRYIVKDDSRHGVTRILYAI